MIVDPDAAHFELMERVEKLEKDADETKKDLGLMFAELKAHHGALVILMRGHN